METNIQPITPTKPNWPHVASFLGLTFGLTWLVDLALYLTGGLTNPAASLILQFQMLLPAFSAMLLGAFFFKERFPGLALGAIVVLLFLRAPVWKVKDSE